MKNQLAHLSLYYKAMKNRPAHGNLDSSTKLVLQSNEKSSPLRETSIPVLSPYYKAMKNNSRLTETSIPVLGLYYKAMKFSRPRETSSPVLSSYYKAMKEAAGSGKHRLED